MNTAQAGSNGPKTTDRRGRDQIDSGEDRLETGEPQQSSGNGSGSTDGRGGDRIKNKEDSNQIGEYERIYIYCVIMHCFNLFLLCINLIREYSAR